MNGYKLLADSYKKILERQQAEDEDTTATEKEIKILELLATLEADEIQSIFDTGAYNEVVKAYCYKAMQNSNIEQAQIGEVMGELKYLIDTIPAKDIIKA